MWISTRSNSLSVEKLANIFDHRCFVFCEEPCIILALGKDFIFKWEGSRWDKLNLGRVAIPRNTLLFGEATFESRGQGKGLLRSPIVRIFDAFSLGNERISHLPLSTRLKCIGKFCRAVSKEKSQPQLTRLCLAEAVELQAIANFKTRLSKISLKGADRVSVQSVSDSTYLAAKGMLFVRIMKEPWTIAWSKKNKRTYFFHGKTAQSRFEAPETGEADKEFESTYAERLIWDWKTPDVVFEPSNKFGIPSFDEVTAHVHNKLVENEILKP